MSLVVDASVAQKWFLSGEPHAKRALAVVQSGISLIAPDPVIAEVCHVAIPGQLDHPVYNCLYVALSEAEQATLVTADAQLLDKVRGTPWERLTISVAEYTRGC